MQTTCRGEGRHSTHPSNNGWRWLHIFIEHELQTRGGGGVTHHALIKRDMWTRDRLSHASNTKGEEDKPPTPASIAINLCKACTVSARPANDPLYLVPPPGCRQICANVRAGSLFLDFTFLLACSDNSGGWSWSDVEDRVGDKSSTLVSPTYSSWIPVDSSGFHCIPLEYTYVWIFYFYLLYSRYIPGHSRSFQFIPVHSSWF